MSEERNFERLRLKDVTIVILEDYDYVRFAWIADPQGNRIVLWESRK